MRRARNFVGPNEGVMSSNDHSRSTAPVRPLALN